MDKSISVILNSKVVETKTGNQLASLLFEAMDINAKTIVGTAVALNGVVVPKVLWIDKRLQEGDRVEVIKATQGG